MFYIVRLSLIFLALNSGYSKYLKDHCIRLQAFESQSYCIACFDDSEFKSCTRSAKQNHEELYEQQCYQTCCHNTDKVSFPTNMFKTCASLGQQKIAQQKTAFLFYSLIGIGSFCLLGCAVIIIIYRVRKQSQTTLHTNSPYVYPSSLHPPNRKSHQSILQQNSDYKFPQVVKQGHQACCICLEQGIDTITSCLHKFHLKCIIEWLKRSQQCPLCKSTRIFMATVYCIQCGHQIKTVSLETLNMKQTSLQCEQCN